MAAYKRFFIPLKGGKLLAERLQDNTVRLTLIIRYTGKKPLDLWLFDSEKAYRYPKTLYADRNGNIVLRQILKDTGLSEIRCACLLDDERQTAAEGFSGEKLDWQNIMLKGSMPEVTTEEFKDCVRDIVEELDEELSPEQPKASGLPEGCDWQQIDLNRLAGDKRLWRYARNPFVSEEYRKYEHLLLGENDKFCFLAVPCSPEERYLGRSQGFRMYSASDGQNYCILKCEK